MTNTLNIKLPSSRQILFIATFGAFDFFLSRKAIPNTYLTYRFLWIHVNVPIMQNLNIFFWCKAGYEEELWINISKGGDWAMIPQPSWTPLRVFCFKLEPGRAGAEGGREGWTVFKWDADGRRDSRVDQNLVSSISLLLWTPLSFLSSYSVQCGKKWSSGPSY